MHGDGNKVKKSTFCGLQSASVIHRVQISRDNEEELNSLWVSTEKHSEI